MLPRHLEDSSVRTFRNKRVAVGQALRRADIWTVETVRIQWCYKAGLCRRILPLNLQGYRVNLQHSGVIAYRIF
ncbi:hypothetical protein D3C78_1804060 [compost metagenome]